MSKADRRVPVKRLIPRVKRFTAKGEDVWVCRDQDVTSLEAAIEEIAKALAIGKANGLVGSVVTMIEQEIEALDRAALP